MITKLTMALAESIFKEPGDYIIVDVRRPDEFAAGHIPNAINVPNESITAAPVSLPDKNQKIYVYCRSGVRSNQAAHKLEALGYSDINDCGGIIDWTGEIE